MTNNKVIAIISGLIGLGLLIAALIFFLKSDKLNLELIQTKRIMQQAKKETAAAQEEKDKLAKKNEKLEADTVSYVSVNTNLQKEKENLQTRLKDAQKIIENREADLQRLKKTFEQIEEKIKKEKNVRNEKAIDEKKELQEKVSSLETTLQKERALYYYNLGVAYTQSKLYDEAVEVYEKSLKFNNDNPEAHYNLALLYDNFQQDSEKAISHYQKYLELKPDADDKEEVEDWIKRLK